MQVWLRTREQLHAVPEATAAKAAILNSIRYVSRTGGACEHAEAAEWCSGSRCGCLHARLFEILVAQGQFRIKRWA